jgi:hypothetical protein
VEQAIIRSAKHKLRNLLFYNYSQYQESVFFNNGEEQDSYLRHILILVDQEGITFGEIDCLKAIESVVHSDNSEGVQIGQDVVFYNEPGEIKANLEPHIRKALKVALMDFIREHHVNGITRESQILLKEIQNELLPSLLDLFHPLNVAQYNSKFLPSLFALRLM